MNFLILFIGVLSVCVSISSGCVFENCQCESYDYLFVEGCKSGLGFPKRSTSDKRSDIETLDFADLGLEEIPANQFNDLKVGYFDLSNNQITELKSGTFTGAKILALVLKDNKLRNIDSDVFKPLETINTLWLSGNQLSKMDINELTEVLQSLEKLTTLGLSKNGLHQLPDLSHMVKCNDLQLAGNELVSLMQSNPEKFLLPDNLLTLSLNDNKIKEIDPRWFQNLKKLKHLSLASNKIEYIDADTFKDLTNLHTLSLSKNYIAHIPTGTFQAHQYLNRLDLSSQHLKKLLIDNYAFDRNSDTFMETLDLSNNRIDSLPNKVFCSHNKDHPYMAIKTVDLAANEIQNLNPCIMRQLAKGNRLAVSKQEYYQKPVVRFVANKAIHTNVEFIKCDCNVTNSARIVALEGSCSNDAKTLIKLKDYQCGLMNALGNDINKDLDKLCINSAQDCEENDSLDNSFVPEDNYNSKYTMTSNDLFSTKSDLSAEPSDVVNNNLNTHTSSNNNNKKERNMNEVTNKPSQIGSGPNGSSSINKFSFISMFTLITSTFLLIRLG